MANVIYRGPVAREPQTVNLPVAGAYLPGRFVTSDGSTLTAAAGPENRLFLLTNRNFYDQSITTAYASGDTGVALRLDPNMEVNALFEAGTYANGDPLTVSANGRLEAAASDDIVVAYYDGTGDTLSAGDFDDAVIANSYTATA